MIKTVLISKFPIPYEGIASWTTRYSYLLKSEYNPIETIICPEFTKKDENIDYCFAKKVFDIKYIRYLVSKFIKYYNNYAYWVCLKKIIDKNSDPLIVHIVDDLGLLTTIDYYARRFGLRDKIKILYCLCGYHYFLVPSELEKFYNMIDDLVLLTKSSCTYQVEQTHTIPCEVTQIYNGINSKTFKKITVQEKTFLRKQIGLEKDKLYFLWLSQDRPKKGLHIVLRAWSQLIKKYANIELLIIGTHNEIKGKQVKWLGRIPNDQLTPYYQASDFYLFSTLCHEGHPMSLTEAMKCGSVCIASDIDPVAEVMGDGKYGRLVDFPNMPEKWVDVISEEIEKYEQNNRINIYQKNIPENIYDLDEWCDNINKLVEKWKKYIQ